LTKIIPLLCCVVVAALLASVALAHTFAAPTQITRSKLPRGTTAAGAAIVIFGNVRSSHPLCIRDRAVRLKRVVTPGPDLVLETTYTNRMGGYYFVRHPQRDQTVYMAVRRLVQMPAGHSHTCFASRTKNLVIDVR